MRSDISNFEKKIKINIKNKSLLLRALTHKSSDTDINNEKLEFLGDRVIGLVLSKKLFDLYPSESEGILDKKFATLVNRKTCCSIGLSIGIQNVIRIANLKKRLSYKDEKILSDACEALIGAIYVDKGFSYVEEFVLRLWKQKITESNILILDSKTQLQEHSLKNYKKLPTYSFLGSKGPKHNPTFKVSVSIYGSKKFIGIGSSKQQAELNAARNLLKSINII